MARDGKTKTPKIRCAIYCRKSTEEGLDQEFNSLDAQREAGEAYVASMKHEGWTCLPDRYDDGGFSGGNMDRPSLRQLIEDIDAGKIDVVVVYKVDRLSRSLLDFARIMESFDKANVSFVSVTQQFNTTHSMGRLTLNVLLSFAQFEREIIGERIRDKIAAQRRRGKWCGGKPILGYDVDRSGPSPRLVVNELEAIRVREIFQLYRELGSLLPVVEELNTRGWCNKSWVTKRGQPRGGSPFDKGSLHALLVNPLYVGKIKHKQDLYDGEHPAIVDRKLFQAVRDQLRFNANDRGPLTRNRNGALLRGLLHCQACDRMMVHTFSTSGSRKYRYYKCCKSIKSGRASCPTPSLPANEIERLVLDEIRQIGTDKTLQKAVLESAEKQLAERRKTLDRDIAGLKRELAKLDNQAANESDADTGEPERDVAASRERLEELQSERDQLASTRLNRRDVNRRLREFDDVWQNLTRREQLELITLLVARVDYDSMEETIEISFHPTGIQSLTQQHEEVTA